MKLLYLLTFISAVVCYATAELPPPPPEDDVPPSPEELEEMEMIERSMTGCKNQFSTYTCKSYKRRGYCKHAMFKKKCAQTCGGCMNKDAGGGGGNYVVPKNRKFYGKCGTTENPLRYLFSHRIIGGDDAQYGTIPWQAGIYNAKTNSAFCGAALISRQVLLTAAHCFAKGKKPSSYFIFLGKHHRHIMDKDKAQKKFDIDQIIIHPDYNKKTQENDIAIIKLKTKATYDTFIRPVCLPKATTRLYSGRLALVSGYGVTDAKRKTTEDVLQQVNVKIIKTATCNDWLNKHTYGQYKVSDNMVCAGHSKGGKDSCQGDSGGPLVVENNRQHYLAGIVSWGIGCGKSERPGVYVRVQKYLDWIADNSL